MAQTSSRGTQLTIGLLARYLRCRWLLLVSGALFGMLASTPFALEMASTFRAVATLRILDGVDVRAIGAGSAVVPIDVYDSHEKLVVFKSARLVNAYATRYQITEIEKRRLMANVRTVRAHRATGLVSVTFVEKSPEAALVLLERYIALANEFITNSQAMAMKSEKDRAREMRHVGMVSTRFATRMLLANAETELRLRLQVEPIRIVDKVWDDDAQRKWSVSAILVVGTAIGAYVVFLATIVSVALKRQ